MKPERTASRERGQKVHESDYFLFGATGVFEKKIERARTAEAFFEMTKSPFIHFSFSRIRGKT